MDIVQKLLNSLITSFLFVILVTSFTVNAEEIRQYKELPKASEIKPPPPRRDKSPGIKFRKASEMQAPSGARKRVLFMTEQMQRLGYLEVDDDAISYLSLDNVKAKFLPIEDITNNLSSPLSIIFNKTGIYKTMLFKGAVVSDPEKKTAKWTYVSRYFSLANGRILMLSELDYKAAKSFVTIPEEFVNENINGSPAILRTKKTTSGKFFTVLSWHTENKRYALHLSDRIPGVGMKNELVILATSIQEP